MEVKVWAGDVLLGGGGFRTIRTFGKLLCR